MTENEQAALDAAGGVVVYVPEGAQTHAALSALRTMGLTGFRIVQQAGLADALQHAAVVVLPDNHHWPEDAALDAAVAQYVRSGGGVLALGDGALLARRTGLLTFTPVEAGMEGRTHVGIDPTALREHVPADVLPDGASVELRTRRGPFFIVP
jgi:hypothetical protein